MKSMELVIGRKNDIYLIDNIRKLDMFNSNMLKELILKMVEKNIECFILNMEHVRVIDSSGIGALIYISSTIKKMNLRMGIVNVNESVQKAFEVTKLEDYFPVLPSLHAAVEAMQ
jgi:anti-sigma B factor antagonist